MTVSLNLGDLGLSVRAYNALRSAKINTIDDFISTPLTEIIKYRNVGVMSMAEYSKAKDFILSGMREEKIINSPIIPEKELDSYISKLELVLNYQQKILDNNKLLFN